MPMPGDYIVFWPGDADADFRSRGFRRDFRKSPSPSHSPPGRLAVRSSSSSSPFEKVVVMETWFFFFCIRGRPRPRRRPESGLGSMVVRSCTRRKGSHQSSVVDVRRNRAVVHLEDVLDGGLEDRVRRKVVLKREDGSGNGLEP